jgi:hypothetical protein
VDADVVVVIVMAFGARCHENDGLWARKHGCYFLVPAKFSRLRLSNQVAASLMITTSPEISPMVKLSSCVTCKLKLQYSIRF